MSLVLLAVGAGIFAQGAGAIPPPQLLFFVHGAMIDENMMAHPAAPQDGPLFCLPRSVGSNQQLGVFLTRPAFCCALLLRRVVRDGPGIRRRRELRPSQIPVRTCVDARHR